MTIKALAAQREHNTESVAAHLLEPQRTWVSKALKNIHCSHVAITRQTV